MRARLCHSAGMRRSLALLPLLLAAACKPPASDEYVERSRIAGDASGPSEPAPSPDSEGAIWAPSGKPQRLLYGKPGGRPLMALECETTQGIPLLAYTRFAAADAHAKAILALIGNGHVSRLKIDAVEHKGAWLWKGAVAAEDPLLDVLTGAREVEATVPGAGSLILNPSNLPGELVEACRAIAKPAPSLPADPA